MKSASSLAADELPVFSPQTTRRYEGLSSMQGAKGKKQASRRNVVE
jgi:hypothetical protein